MSKAPPTLLTETLGFRIWTGTAKAMDSFHRHNEIEANLVLSGTLKYSFGPASYTVRQGQLALFWGSVPHRLDLAGGPAAKVIWFTVPLTWLLQWNLPRALNAALLQGKLLIDREQGAYARDLPVFKQWCADFSRKPSDVWEPLLQAEIQNRLRRLALHLQVLHQSPAEAGAGDAPRVDSMARYLHEHFTGPVNAAGLAKHLGLNPHYTQRLFRQAFGISLVEYVTMLRLSQAQRLLASTDQKLVDLAADCGYPTLSRFYDAFRRECHMTPRQYRLKVRTR